MILYTKTLVGSHHVSVWRSIVYVRHTATLVGSHNFLVWRSIVSVRHNDLDYR